MVIVTTSIKGQVVIPKKERERLGIKPGAKVMIETVKDHIEIRPLPEEPIEYLCGIFENCRESLTGALIDERNKERKHEQNKTAGLIRNTGSAKKRR